MLIALPRCTGNVRLLLIRLAALRTCSALPSGSSVSSNQSRRIAVKRRRGDSPAPRVRRSRRPCWPTQALTTRRVPLRRPALFRLHGWRMSPVDRVGHFACVSQSLPVRLRTCASGSQTSHLSRRWASGLWCLIATRAHSPGTSSTHTTATSVNGQGSLHASSGKTTILAFGLRGHGPPLTLPLNLFWRWPHDPSQEDSYRQRVTRSAARSPNRRITAALHQP